MASPHNGIALSYAREVLAALDAAGARLPICMGERLNQVADDSNSALPMDVGAEIGALGIASCEAPAMMTEMLEHLALARCRARSYGVAGGSAR